MTEPNAPERREHARMAPKGAVTLRSERHELRGRIANLSHGGLAVATSVTAPSNLLERVVEGELRLDGQSAEWLKFTGRVSRIGAFTIAVVFETVPDALIALTNDASVASYAHGRVMSVVLVDGDPVRRAALTEGFLVVGCTVVESATALEAIVRLGESRFEPDLIAVVDSLPSATADELRGFIQREHPRARLVAIGAELIAPRGSAHWLSASDPASDLAARIRGVLGGPDLGGAAS